MAGNRARGVALAIVGVTTFAVGFLPLFDGPGYEQSLAAGVVLPITSAVVAAFEGFTNRREVSARAPVEEVARGMVTALLLALTAVATALIHAARVGFCDPLGGLATFALGPGLGAVLAGVAGSSVAVLVGHFVDRRRRRRAIAVGLALSAPILSALVAGAYFYFTPAVFAFDPYVGFFSGTLYDEVVDAWGALLTYRAGTALTIVAVLGAAAATSRDHARSPDPRSGGGLDWKAGARGWLWLTLIAGGASVVLVALGPRLGHRTTAATVRDALGGARQGGRCEVVYPRATSDDEAALLVRDCVEELAAVEKRLGVRGPERLTAFFFRDAAQKRELIGAANTYVAKPWRREVYLQIAGYPHPVLGHEIAHVVAGSVGRGPFCVAGDARGWLPNPGLIEGVAVAASPDRDELTPAQWAHAMKEIAVLPPLRRVFGGGFFTQNAAIAYTVAGAFVEWHLDGGRGDAVRAWYAGVPFAQAFGAPFSEMEARWRESLDTVPLPPEALAVARARFDRPAIWGRRCPHVVERLRGKADRCRQEGDLAGADRTLGDLLRLDVADPWARLERAKLARDRGDRAGMTAQVRAITEDPRTSTIWRNRAREILADELLHEPKLDEARAIYEAARKEVLDEDWSRTLDVKAFATTSAERAATVGRLLVGKREHRDETVVATIALAAETARARDDVPPEDGALARYLLARRLVEARTWQEAESMLAAIATDDLARVSVRLVREAARLRLVIACVAPPGASDRAPEDVRRARVADALARYLAAPPANAGRREGVERMAARCAL